MYIYMYTYIGWYMYCMHDQLPFNLELETLILKIKSSYLGCSEIWHSKISYFESEHLLISICVHTLSNSQSRLRGWLSIFLHVLVLVQTTASPQSLPMANLEADTNIWEERDMMSYIYCTHISKHMCVYMCVCLCTYFPFHTCASWVK